MKKPKLDGVKFVPAYLKGTAYGYDRAGQKVITVTAHQVQTDDVFYKKLLLLNLKGLNPMVGESLAGWAERVAGLAGIPVASWQIEGQAVEADPMGEDEIH